MLDRLSRLLRLMAGLVLALVFILPSAARAEEQVRFVPQLPLSSFDPMHVAFPRENTPAIRSTSASTPARVTPRWKR